MATYKIPFTVEMSGEYIIEAESVEDAMSKAETLRIDESVKPLSYVNASYSAEEYMVEVEVDGKFIYVEEEYN